MTNTAIQDEGLDVERYDTVIQVASVDDELRNRLLTEIEGLMAEQQPDR